MEKLKKLMEDIDMPAEAAARVLAAEPPFFRGSDGSAFGKADRQGPL